MDVIPNAGLIARNTVQWCAFSVIAEFSHGTALTVVYAVFTNAFAFVAYGTECVALGVFVAGNSGWATNMFDTDEGSFAVVVHVAFATGIFETDAFFAVRVIEAG